MVARGHNRGASLTGLEDGGGVMVFIGPRVHTHSRGRLLRRVTGVEGQTSLSDSSSEDESRLSPQLASLMGRAVLLRCCLCF